MRISIWRKRPIPSKFIYTEKENILRNIGPQSRELLFPTLDFEMFVSNMIVSRIIFKNHFWQLKRPLYQVQFGTLETNNPDIDHLQPSIRFNDF